MDALVGFLRFAFERAAYFALIILLFSAVVPFAGQWGIAVPPIVREWSGVALIGCGVVLATHIVGWLFGKLRRAIELAAASARANEDEIEESRRIFSSLTQDEAIILHEYLQGDLPMRFEVLYLSDARRLVQKGAFVVKRRKGLDMLCEVRPSLWDARVAIRKAIEKEGLITLV